MLELLHELYDKLNYAQSGSVWGFDLNIHYNPVLEDYAYITLVSEGNDQTKTPHYLALMDENFDLETFIKTCIEGLEGEAK